MMKLNQPMTPRKGWRVVKDQNIGNCDICNRVIKIGDLVYAIPVDSGYRSIYRLIAMHKLCMIKRIEAAPEDSDEIRIGYQAIRNRVLNGGSFL